MVEAICGPDGIVSEPVIVAALEDGPCAGDVMETPIWARTIWWEGGGGEAHHSQRIPEWVTHRYEWTGQVKVEAGELVRVYCWKEAEVG